MSDDPKTTPSQPEGDRETIEKELQEKGRPEKRPSDRSPPRKR